MATWLDVRRRLRAAGWRYERRYLQPTRDWQTGAPEDEGSWEHRWTRGEGAITAYTDWGEPGTVGWLSLWEPADGDESASITARILARRGPDWALQALALLGVSAGEETHV